MVGEYEFKIATNNKKSYIVLNDGINEVKLPLIYISISNSEVIWDSIEELGQLFDSVKSKTITKDEYEQLDNEQKLLLLKENMSFMKKMGKTILPKLVNYFEITIKEEYNRELNKDELVALEKLILANLEDVLTKYMAFINEVMPADVGSKPLPRQQ